MVASFTCLIGCSRVLSLTMDCRLAAFASLGFHQQ